MGISGYVWWGYEPSKVMDGLEKAIVQSTVNARPIKMDSLHDQLITRGFLGDTNMVIWAVNSADHPYAASQFHLASGAIAGNVDYEQWTKSGSATGKGTATQSDPSTFVLDLPPNTITKFVFPYTPPASAATDKKPADADTNSIPMPH